MKILEKRRWKRKDGEKTKGKDRSCRKVISTTGWLSEPKV